MNFIDRRNNREDFFQAYIVPGKGEKPTLMMLTPSMVLHVPDRDELEHQLEYYNTLFISQVGAQEPQARRWYVEHMRPCLRYWCHKFGKEIPSWLENEETYTEMPDDQKQELFGTTELEIQEFRKFKRPKLADIQQSMSAGDGESPAQ